VALHRRERPSRLWIQIQSLKSVYLLNIPQSVPLPLAEGTDRGVWRETPTYKTESIMDSKPIAQVGVSLESPPIGPLYLWERARVRVDNLQPITLAPDRLYSSPSIPATAPAFFPGKRLNLEEPLTLTLPKRRTAQRERGLTESIMDSTPIAQVGGTLESPPIGPLSQWERARVRGRQSPANHLSAGSPMFIFFHPCNSTCAFGSCPLSRYH